jgi:hypothetical protein
LLAPKKRTKEKAPGSLAFGSPREALYRGGGKNSLRSNNSRLHPLSSVSLGCAATGFKTKKLRNQDFNDFARVLHLNIFERL